MKKLLDLLEIIEPRGEGEKRFFRLHSRNVKKHKDPAGNDGKVYSADNIKPVADNHMLPHLDDRGKVDEAKMSVGGHVWKAAMDNPFVVRATKGKVSNEKIGQYKTPEEARAEAKKWKDAKIFHAVSGKELKEETEQEIYEDSNWRAKTRVRKGGVYQFHATGWDRFDRRDYTPENGTHVRVVHAKGAPPPNTMGHAHIESMDGKFIGLVSTASLKPRNYKAQQNEETEPVNELTREALRAYMRASTKDSRSTQNKINDLGGISAAARKDPKLLHKAARRDSYHKLAFRKVYPDDPELEPPKVAGTHDDKQYLHQNIRKYRYESTNESTVYRKNPSTGRWGHHHDKSDPYLVYDKNDNLIGKHWNAKRAEKLRDTKGGEGSYYVLQSRRNKGID